MIAIDYTLAPNQICVHARVLSTGTDTSTFITLPSFHLPLRYTSVGQIERSNGISSAQPLIPRRDIGMERRNSTCAVRMRCATARNASMTRDSLAVSNHNLGYVTFWRRGMMQNGNPRTAR